MSNTRLPRSRRHARRPLAACLAVALLAPTALALAAPAVVNCDDSGAGSLRASVAAAGSSDVIDLSGLSCNAISLASALQTNGIADLTVRAGAAQNFSIAGSGADRVFSHAGSGRLTLENLALSKGRAGDVGGCVVSQADLSLTNVTLDACAAGGNAVDGARGGAVAAMGNATLANVRITGSRVDGTGRVFGGGIFVGGNLDGTDVVVTGNTAHTHLAEPAAQFGNVAQGGGIHAHGPTTLRNATITGNTAKSDSYEVFGGGLSVGSREQGSPSASLDLVASTVSGNTNVSECGVCAPQGGGGIVIGDARLSRVTIADNTVTSTNHYGGAGGFRFFTGGESVTAEITDSTISGNHADSAGGGMIGPDRSVLSIARTRIENNVGANDAGIDEAGGGILGFGTSVQLVDSSITGNTSGADGGGINILFGEYAPQPTRVINSTISGNTAREGGGIMADGGNFEFANSTIAFNTATRRGAGISGTEYTYGIRLDSTIVANNSTNGTATNLWSFPKIVTGSKNLIPNANSPADLPGDTLTADPELAPLADNGGPTKTHALAATSPAIDAGSAGGLAYDQRGAFWVRVSGAAADIGAYEAQPTPDTIFTNGFETQN